MKLAKSSLGGSNTGQLALGLNLKNVVKSTVDQTSHKANYPVNFCYRPVLGEQI